MNLDAADRERLRTAGFVLGGLSLAAAVVVALGIGGERPVRLLAGILPVARWAVLLLGLGAAAVGLLAVLTEPLADDDGVTLPPDRRTETRDDAVVGRETDDTLRAIVDSTDGGGAWKRVRLRGDLRSLAIELLRTEHGMDVDEAAAAIDTGEWTDDPRAAAYLGDVPLPVRLRVSDWASGNPYERRVTATAAEIARLADVDVARDPDGALAGRPADDPGAEPEVTDS